MKSALAVPPDFGSHHVHIHYKRPFLDDMIILDGPEIVAKLFRGLMGRMRMDVKEHLWAFLVTNSNRLIGVASISKGSHRNLIVDSRELFQLALLSQTTGIVLAHNHPSGNLNPSEKDITFTQHVAKGCRLLDLILLDHLIITSESFFSFSTENLL